MKLRILSKEAISKFNFPIWSVTIALLALCVISYGLFATKLGFYWDDWPVIYLAKTHGNFWQYYQFDRPFSTWIDVFTTWLLGTRPLYWHLFFLLIRWLTVLLMWWGLTQVWPRHTRQVTCVAFLFVVYPAFISQPVAVTYVRLFLDYALFFASLAAMIAAARYRRWFWPITIFALLAALVQMFTLEYFLGLELVRPVLLWIVFSDSLLKVRDRVLPTLKAWAPYLFVLVIFVIWRLFFLKLADDPNTPELLNTFIDQPLSTIPRLVTIVLQDFSNIFVTSWYPTFQSNLFVFQPQFSLFAWGIVFLIVGGVILYFLRMHHNYPEDSTDFQNGWIKQALFVGVYFSFVGMLPVWSTGRQVNSGMWADRFTLPAIFGASILIVGLLEFFIQARLQKVIFLGLLIGLAIGLQVRTENNYRWDWTLQRRFYWELYWRAPSVKPGTAFVSEEGIFQYTAKYSLATAINTLYAPSSGTTALPYWAYELDDMTAILPDIPRGVELQGNMRSLSFKASSLDILPIFYDRSGLSCVWILSAQDAVNPELPPLITRILSVANLNQIEIIPNSSSYPDAAIFGAEPPHNWCYFFEKADLARQLGDWKAVSQLGDEVQRLGYRPNYFYEWVPFIEGYAHTGDWDKAQSLTLAVHRDDPYLDSALCTIWDRLSGSTLSSPARDATTDAVIQKLECSTP